MFDELFVLFVYSVAVSSIVCEIGPINPASNHWGQVEVEVKGGKRGTSSIYFTYRVNSHSRTHTQSLALALFFILSHSCAYSTDAFNV